LVIKKGKKNVWRFPRFLKNRKQYKWKLRVSNDMLSIDDKCDSGWNKVTGIGMLWHHINSYRLVNRIRDNKLYFGYYCYVDGVSPQDNSTFKSHISDNNSIVSASNNDIISFVVKFNKISHYIYIKIHNLTTNKFVSTSLPMYEWISYPKYELEPSLKCRSILDIEYDFI